MVIDHCREPLQLPECNAYISRYTVTNETVVISGQIFLHGVGALLSLRQLKLTRWIFEIIGILITISPIDDLYQGLTILPKFAQVDYNCLSLIYEQAHFKKRFLMRKHMKTFFICNSQDCNIERKKTEVCDLQS